MLLAVPSFCTQTASGRPLSSIETLGVEAARLLDSSGTAPSQNSLLLSKVLTNKSLPERQDTTAWSVISPISFIALTMSAEMSVSPVPVPSNSGGADGPNQRRAYTLPSVVIQATMLFPLESE